MLAKIPELSCFRKELQLLRFWKPKYLQIALEGWQKHPRPKTREEVKNERKTSTFWVQNLEHFQPQTLTSRRWESLSWPNQAPGKTVRFHRGGRRSARPRLRDTRRQVGQINSNVSASFKRRNPHGSHLLRTISVELKRTVYSEPFLRQRLASFSAPGVIEGGGVAKLTEEGQTNSASKTVKNYY